MNDFSGPFRGLTGNPVPVTWLICSEPSAHIPPVKSVGLVEEFFQNFTVFQGDLVNEAAAQKLCLGNRCMRNCDGKNQRNSTGHMHRSLWIPYHSISGLFVIPGVYSSRTTLINRNQIAVYPQVGVRGCVKFCVVVRYTSTEGYKSESECQYSKKSRFMKIIGAPPERVLRSGLFRLTSARSEPR